MIIITIMYYHAYLAIIEICLIYLINICVAII